MGKDLFREHDMAALEDVVCPLPSEHAEDRHDEHRGSRSSSSQSSSSSSSRTSSYCQDALLPGDDAWPGALRLVAQPPEGWPHLPMLWLSAGDNRAVRCTRALLNLLGLPCEEQPSFNFLDLLSTRDNQVSDFTRWLQLLERDVRERQGEIFFDLILKPPRSRVKCNMHYLFPYDESVPSDVEAHRMRVENHAVSKSGASTERLSLTFLLVGVEMRVCNQTQSNPFKNSDKVKLPATSKVRL